MNNGIFSLENNGHYYDTKHNTQSIAKSTHRLIKFIQSTVLFTLLSLGSPALAQVCGITSNSDAMINTQVWWSGFSSLGDEYTLDFSSGVAVLTNAASGTSAGHQGTATYTNAEGDLLLYSDGDKIYDGQTNVLIADNIGGATSTAQSAAIAPVPGGDPENDFYVFWNFSGRSSMGYITVDRAAGTATNNTVLNTLVSESLTLIPHGNGADFWVLVADVSAADTFYVYKADVSGINIVSTQVLPINYFSASRSQVVFSPATNKIAITGVVEPIVIADFDVNTGTISNSELRLATSTKMYGITFSSSGNRLYYARLESLGGGIHYHDLSGAVNNSTAVPGTSALYTTPQLAIDGKIYVTRGPNSHLGIVSDPDGSPSFSTLSLGSKRAASFLVNTTYPACNILKPTCLNYDVEAFDIDQTIYNGIQLDLGSDDPREVEFNNDGTKMYVLTRTSPARTIKEYDLNIPWDNSTAIYSGNSISGLGFNLTMSFKFAPDGSRFFLTDAISDAVYQYDLSPAWDITSATLITALSATESNIYGVTFNDDGKKMYLSGTEKEISEYDLVLPYTLAGFTYVQSFSTSPTFSIPTAVEFSNNGLEMFVSGVEGINSGKIYRYNLTTPWDISTAILSSSFSVSSQHSEAYGLTFSKNGRYIYMAGSLFTDPGKNEITRYCIGRCNFTEDVLIDFGKPTAGESMTISIENDTFTNAGNTLIHGVDYTINNLPDGLTPTLSVATNGLSADLTLSGNATNHFAADSLTDLTFTWADGAFTSTPAAALCTGTGPTSSNVGVIFNNGSDYGDANDSYSNGGHGSVNAGNLYLGGTAPDGDPKFNLLSGDSGTDDNDGVDDEDPIILNQYKYEGGMICTGSSGTYTTAAYEYCMVVNATNSTGSVAQVVGWLDFGDGVGGTNPNGEFDANERSITSPAGSNPTAVDDGTFTTGNLPNGVTRDVVLVFSGLGHGVAQSRNATNIRIRVSTDASLFSDASPSPTGDLPDGEIEDHPLSLGTLPVMLNHVDSDKVNNKLMLYWNTASEMYNIGFNLYGRGGSIRKWQVLNPRLELVKGGNGAEPKRYKKAITLSDELSQIDELLISSMDVDGVEHYYGPFKIGRSYGNGEQLKPIDWDKIKTQMDARMANKGYTKGRFGRYRLIIGDSHNSSKESLKSSLADQIIEFSVDSEGLYRILGRDLPKSWQGIAVESLAIVDSNGNPIARHGVAVVTKSGRRRFNRRRNRGAIGELGSLTFYATALNEQQRLYSDVKYYQLVHDKTLVRDIIKQRRRVVKDEVSEFYTHTQKLESDERFLSATTTDDPWVSEVITSTKRRTKQTSQVFRLDNARLDQDIDIVIGAGRITAMRPVDADGDGVQDDEYVMTGLFYDEHNTLQRLQRRTGIGRGDWTAHFTIAGGSLSQITDDLLAVGAEFSVGEGYRINQTALDYMSLSYARDYRVLPGERYLEFADPQDDSAGFEVMIPQDRRLSVYAALDGKLAKIQPQRGRRASIDGVRQVTLRFARLAGSEALTNEGQVRYWVGGESGYKRVLNVTEKPVVSQAKLLEQASGANYVIVAHPSFLGEDSTGRDAVMEFVEHKRGQGYTVSLVDYLQLIDSFASGQPGPEGLRRYLQAVQEQGYLQYVLLIGGGSYDYKDILEKGSITTIPSLYAPTDYFSKYTNTDVDYVRANDGSLFAAIGRWPVRTIDETAMMVDKHLRWANRVIANDKAIFVAENTDSRSGIDFARALSGIKSALPEKVEAEGIFVKDRLAADESITAIQASQAVRTRFIEALNADPEYVFYNGHASSGGLGKPTLFSANDASKLEQGASMWMPLACYVTFYQSVEVNTLAHQLLFNGPALSISGATSYSDQNQNMYMAQGIVKSLFNESRSLGQATNATHGRVDQRTLQTNWATLGDPSIKR